MTASKPAFAFSRRALASVAALCAIGSAQAAPLDDMIAFDGIYIQALAMSTSASLDPAVIPRAETSLAALAQQWPALRHRLSATWGPKPPAGWQLTLAGVGLHIDAAVAASRRSAWKHTHEALEPVRIELMQARRRQGTDYFVDRLTAFHEPMEALAVAGSTLRADQLDAKRRAELERSYVQARTLWRDVDQHTVDGAAYGLSAPREAQLRKALDGETAALGQLSDPLRRSDNGRLLKSAVAIKPLFAKAFTAFGQTDGGPAR
jgi:hypothetical protein